MRKKVDERIRTLIEHGVKTRHRSMFVMVGDKSRDQILNLYYMLTKIATDARPKVLWCYKDKLELSSHKKKRAKQVKKLLQKGLLDPEKADPLALFIESGVISYHLYKDTERVQWNTYSMCILQDFEALTPNIIAQTIDTVQGGGLVILLLRSLSSLTSLCSMVMDIHRRFRTESHSVIGSRFDERFLLSLASCKACLVMDDELNILPISSHVKSIDRSSVSEGSNSMKTHKKLKSLKEEHCDVALTGPLLGMCHPKIRAMLDKAVHRTVALISSQGRGKSAALGLAIAGAVALGYPRIFVTAPSPENLKVLFDFVCQGLSALKYEEHLHYDRVKCRSPETCKTVTRINVYKEHNQMIQYIDPRDQSKLCHAELIVIDEAEAMPLPVVKALLLGQNQVFISSTVNGCEGTEHSFSLKLFNHLEQRSQDSASGNLFQKIELNEPIRYASGDPIERWLNGLLCLDAMNYVSSITGVPHPSECNLFYVNRETLFSFHKESEVFLQRMVGLYVSSHDQNSANDLQVMADDPAHHLFVLLGPVDETSNVLPDILCVIQVCLEGQISRKSLQQRLQRGHLPADDQILWKLCEEFENTDFLTLSGVRIVRMAVHPDALGKGYGSSALDLLTRYYEGKLTAICETDEEHEITGFHQSILQAAKEVSLLEETISPRKDLPPLLTHLNDRAPESVNYIGASFGLKRDLFHFWKKHKFTPLYISNDPNEKTGEHSCIVLKPLEIQDTEHGVLGSLDYLTTFHQRFKRKFVKKLTMSFRDFDYKLAMSILDPRTDFSENNTSSNSENESVTVVKSIFQPDELKMLESFSKNRKDYKKVDHLLPSLAYHFFEEKIPVPLTQIQAEILLCGGLQLHDISYIQDETKQKRQQVLHQIRKIVAKFHKYFYDVLTKSGFPQEREVVLKPCGVRVDEDVEDGERKVVEKMRQEEYGIDPKLLKEYSIKDTESELNEALHKCGKLSASGVLSVKSNRNPSSHKRKRLLPQTNSKTRKRNTLCFS